ncbi:MAG: phosphatase PAP2 family protein [Bacteroidales bacterium]|nr:phosphatase PAP2 family protein [Bacteroidales bacterium]
MRRLWSILLLLVLCAGHPARAQLAVRVDTSATAFHARQLIAPGVLLASGIAIHTLGHDGIDVPVNRWFQESLRGSGPELGFDNYIQYAPLVMELGLGLVGVPAQHGFADRVIETALGAIVLGAVSWTMKSVINSPRPNGVDNRSFPSGHTDWVFFGAELVRMEYGWGWGAGAYAIAATVAVMRNYNNWHWMSDCLAGAGLGILTAHVGRWLLEPTKRAFGIRTGTWGDGRPRTIQAAFAPTVDPLSGTVCTTLALRF